MGSALAALAVTLVLAWLARSRFTTRRGAGELRYPPGIAIIGLVTAAFFSAATVLSLFAATGGPGAAAVFAAFALLGASIVVISSARYRVTTEGLEYHVPFAGRGFASWAEIERVRWSPFAKWFVVTLNGGKTLRPHALLAGLPEFAKTVLAKVPRGRLEPVAIAVLQDAASGRLPSLLG